MKSRLLIAAALSFLGIFLGLAVAEFGLRLYFSSAVSSLRAERENFRDQSASPSFGMVENGQWEDTLRLHPFFGYVGQGRRLAVNRFGFYSVHDITLCGDKLCVAGLGKNPLVVGIFGGSLALQVASDERALEKKLAEKYPGREIAVINFAQPGHAQPQAYFIYSYFRDLVDTAVFLDGLNEIWNPPANNRLGLPPIYAKGAHYRKMGEELAAIRRHKDGLRRATLLSLLPLWRDLALSHLVWEYWRSFHRQQIAALAEGKPDSPFFPGSAESLVRVGVHEWARYHRLLAGKNIFHLLQPTLLAGAKPRTEGERASAALYPDLQKLVDLGYPLLRRELKGFSGRDLSQIFDRETGEIWIDAAHVNTHGREILGAEIVRVLGGSLLPN